MTKQNVPIHFWLRSFTIVLLIALLLPSGRKVRELTHPAPPRHNHRKPLMCDHAMVLGRHPVNRPRITTDDSETYESPAA